MKLCLDTNAYSRLMQKHSGVSQMIEQAEYVYVSSIVLGELYAGFRMGSRYEQNCYELEEFLSLPGIEIIDIDKSIAHRYGILIKQLKKAGTPIPVNDIWIAATALDTGSLVVSYDSHFDMVQGIVLVSP